MTVASGIAQFVAEKNFKNIPHDVWETTKNCFLDYIGVAVAGPSDEVGQIIMRWAKGLDERPQATIINGPRRSVLTAALVNGTLGHALDFDDISTTQLGHPSAAIVPAILALGETLRSTGKEAIAAYVLGLEVCGKIGAVMNPDLASAGWHTTGVLGTLGATVGAAKLLHLRSEQISNSLAIACSEAAGLKVNVGTMTKPLHAGRAAQSGLLAALLAEKGFTGSNDAFEGPNGFGKVFSPRSDVRKILDLLGSPYDILEPGITFKRYPSCGATHPPIDAVLSLLEEHEIKSKDVESVNCFVTPFTKNVLIFPNPKSGTEGKFSLQFCLALAILEKRVDTYQFVDAKVQEISVRNLMNKITMQVEPNWAKEGYTPSIGEAACKVEIRLKNGSHFSKTVAKAKGSKTNPLSHKELEEKFWSCCDGSLRKKQIEEIIATIRNLQNTANVQQLTNLLIGKRR